MEIKISTGNYLVLGSGTLVCLPDKPIEFELIHLKFIIDFKNTEGGKAKIIKKKLDQNTLVLTFENFNNRSGLQTIEPILLGTLWEKKIHLNCSVYSIGEQSGKIFHYTFLQNKD